MTVKEFLMGKIAEATDEQLGRTFSDIVECCECPINNKCKSEYYCDVTAAKYMNEEI